MNLVRIKNRTKQTVNNSIERHPVPILGIDYKVKIIYKNIKITELDVKNKTIRIAGEKKALSVVINFYFCNLFVHFIYC